MPLKKDDTGKRWVEMHFTVPGTPEQVWRAMATGAGNAAWFTKATIEERVGGALRFEFGPEMSSTGEVTQYEPPHLFGYVERDWSPGAPPVVTEITITSRSGDRSVVRMVHSLFSSSDEWDDQMEGFENGWPAFFEVLRIYMTHFAGRAAASFQSMTRVEGDQLAAWARLTEELGLAGANVGETRTTSRGAEQWTGVVERVQQTDAQRVLMMRLESPMAGVAYVSTYGTGGGVLANIGCFYYGDQAETAARASQDKWREWLNEAFAPAQK
jgi:uncharacterized protein YndB with AHSA1/START domain